jgi:hypothetical protein
MAAGRSGSRTPPELSERQRYWLKHIRTAERKGEPLKHYAKRLRLSEQALYEAKRRLRLHGVLAPAPKRRFGSGRFVRVVAAGPKARPASLPLRIQLASGAVLEWAEAPAGEVLRELIGWLR